MQLCCHKVGRSWHCTLMCEWPSYGTDSIPEAAHAVLICPRSLLTPRIVQQEANLDVLHNLDTPKIGSGAFDRVTDIFFCIIARGSRHEVIHRSVRGHWEAGGDASDQGQEGGNGQRWIRRRRPEADKLKGGDHFGQSSCIDSPICPTCTNGQSLHMKAGKSHRCRRAAWNWNGMQKAAMMTSVMAKLPIYKLITVCIRRPVPR